LIAFSHLSASADVESNIFEDASTLLTLTSSSRANLKGLC